jgi:hypothetical protein
VARLNQAIKNNQAQVEAAPKPMSQYLVAMAMAMAMAMAILVLRMRLIDTALGFRTLGSAESSSRGRRSRRDASKHPQAICGILTFLVNAWIWKAISFVAGQQRGI